MVKREYKFLKAGTPTRTQRLGLLALVLIMLAALLIMLFRQETTTPTKCKEELIPLRQLQQYETMEADSVSAPAPQDQPKSKKTKRHKAKKGGKAPKSSEQASPPRKIDEETLSPH